VPTLGTRGRNPAESRMRTTTGSFANAYTALLVKRNTLAPAGPSPSRSHVRRSTRSSFCLVKRAAITSLPLATEPDSGCVEVVQSLYQVSGIGIVLPPYSLRL